MEEVLSEQISLLGGALIKCTKSAFALFRGLPLSNLIFKLANVDSLHELPLASIGTYLGEGNIPAMLLLQNIN